MYIKKKVVLNWYYSVKKKFRKIPMIFDVENWLWKSDLGSFEDPFEWKSKSNQKTIFLKLIFEQEYTSSWPLSSNLKKSMSAWPEIFLGF